MDKYYRRLNLTQGFKYAYSGQYCDSNNIIWGDITSYFYENLPMLFLRGNVVVHANVLNAIEKNNTCSIKDLKKYRVVIYNTYIKDSQTKQYEECEFIFKENANYKNFYDIAKFYVNENYLYPTGKGESLFYYQDNALHKITHQQDISLDAEK